MKAASPALLAMFATNQDFEQFDLYTITLTSGLVLRYTNCSFDVISNGHTFLCSRSAGSVVLEEAAESGPRAHWTNDLSVGTWQVTVLPRLGDVIGDLPWLPAVRAGILNEATVRVDRGYLPAWPAVPALMLVPTGIINVFYGRIGPIDFGRSAVQINMNDPRELLASDQPRELYSANCRYALYDGGCTLNKATFGVNVVVNAVVGLTAIITSAPPVADDQYALGDLTFTSGSNDGLRMMIRASVGATGFLTLLAPLPFEIEVGDALTIFPGCNKTQARCTQFNNLVNFGGFPYIPAAETAI